MLPERKQITVRAVKTATYARLQAVKSVSRMPLGALLDEAVELWWDSLAEVDQDRS